MRPRREALLARVQVVACAASDPEVVASSVVQPEERWVQAEDGHPIKVWSKGPKDGIPVLLLHGRTWSARPVWDLQVEGREGAAYLGASTMDLMAAEGYKTFAPDFRGMGGTSRDTPGWTTPDRCAADMADVLRQMSKEGINKPHVIGWSQGAVVAQLLAQNHPELIDRLVLYGSIFDPKETQDAANFDTTAAPPHVDNTMEGAMEDWSVPGLIDAQAAQAFGDACMVWDARKVSWSNLHEFNALDPSKVVVPTLVVYGAGDVYNSFTNQEHLFSNLGTHDRALRTIPLADHPVHLYPRERQAWWQSVKGFLCG